jgi:Tol biopolymer transport system component/tRNA A-37 threonylcarbamoyl transferase component Bud32
MIGQRLLHYEITEKLGEGGMGVVYKARDTHLDRFVAIKVLPADRVADEDRRRRFVQEAKAASALNHPSIVTIHDIAEADGVDYIAMEYVQGRTLDQLIGRKGLKLPEALSFSIQITDALAKAHAAGIVHRDLKPFNIMVTDEGRVKILDFGLAKLTQPEPEEDDATRTLRPTTEEGAIVGTVAYMSPEQAEGKKVDARSDIFSFGSVFYEMLTGQPAFKGESKVSTLAAILHKDPKPASEIGAALPAEVERVLSRCLRKDPARRFQHMDDIKVALEELKEDSDSGKLWAAAAAPARTRTPWLLVAAVPVVLLLAATGWLLWRNQSALLPPPRVVSLTAYPGSESGPSFSPDGKQVAFSWDGEKQDNIDIYIKMVDSGLPLRLTTDPAPECCPAWSPIGDQIAFVRRQGNQAAVYLVSPLGGPARKLADYRPSVPYLSWHPDGKWLAVTELYQDGTNGISLIPAGPGEKRRLLSAPVSKARYGFPAFSPDGSSLAYLHSDGALNGDFYVLELGPDVAVRGAPRRLSPKSGSFGRIAWSPDGRFLIYGGFDADPYLYRLPVSGAARPERLELAGAGATLPAISRIGNRLAYARALGSSGMDIWRLEPGAPPKRLLSSNLADIDPQFSPDGKRIAYVSADSAGLALWVANQDGANPVQLTHGGSTQRGSPRWSPDGRWIAFDGRSNDGRLDIFVIDAEGGNERRLTSYPSDENLPSWSRDGRWIYFASAKTGRYEVWRMPAAGGEGEQLTDNGGFAAWESWDRKTLYYTKWPSGAGLFARPLAGGPERRVLESLLSYVYFPVEEGIYYVVRSEPGLFEVRFLDFAAGSGRVVRQFKSGTVQSLSVSPDRKTFLYSGIGPESTGSDLMLVENFR